MPSSHVIPTSVASPTPHRSTSLNTPSPSTVLHSPFPIIPTVPFATLDVSAQTPSTTTPTSPTTTFNPYSNHYSVHSTTTFSDDVATINVKEFPQYTTTLKQQQGVISTFVPDGDITNDYLKFPGRHATLSFGFGGDFYFTNSRSNEISKTAVKDLLIDLPPQHELSDYTRKLDSFPGPLLDYSLLAQTPKDSSGSGLFSFLTFGSSASSSSNEKEKISQNQTKLNKLSQITNYLIDRKNEIQNEINTGDTNKYQNDSEGIMMIVNYLIALATFHYNLINAGNNPAEKLKLKQNFAKELVFCVSQSEDFDQSLTETDNFPVFKQTFKDKNEIKTLQDITKNLLYSFNHTQFSEIINTLLLNNLYTHALILSFGFANINHNNSSEDSNTNPSNPNNKDSNLPIQSNSNPFNLNQKDEEINKIIKGYTEQYLEPGTPLYTLYNCFAGGKLKEEIGLHQRGEWWKENLCILLNNMNYFRNVSSVYNLIVETADYLYIQQEKPFTAQFLYLQVPSLFPEKQHNSNNEEIVEKDKRIILIGKDHKTGKEGLSVHDQIFFTEIFLYLKFFVEPPIPSTSPSTIENVRKLLKRFEDKRNAWVFELLDYGYVSIAERYINQSESNSKFFSPSSSGSSKEVDGGSSSSANSTPVKSKGGKQINHPSTGTAVAAGSYPEFWFEDNLNKRYKIHQQQELNNNNYYDSSSSGSGGSGGGGGGGGATSTISRLATLLVGPEQEPLPSPSVSVSVPTSSRSTTQEPIITQDSSSSYYNSDYMTEAKNTGGGGGGIWGEEAAQAMFVPVTRETPEDLNTKESEKRKKEDSREREEKKKRREEKEQQQQQRRKQEEASEPDTQSNTPAESGGGGGGGLLGWLGWRKKAKVDGLGGCKSIEVDEQGRARVPGENWGASAPPPPPSSSFKREDSSSITSTSSSTSNSNSSSSTHTPIVVVESLTPTLYGGLDAPLTPLTPLTPFSLAGTSIGIDTSNTTTSTSTSSSSSSRSPDLRSSAPSLLMQSPVPGASRGRSNRARYDL